jgi:hypothetical protein
MIAALRLVLSLALAFCLTQCVAPQGRHVAPIVGADPTKPVFFTVKGTSGVARQSQVMAAMEDMNEEMKRDQTALRDPVTALVASQGKHSPHGLVILSKTGVAQRLNGQAITLIVPVIGVNAPSVPDAEVAKAMPAIQRYCYTKMSRYFTPVATSELREQPKKR